MDNPLCPECQSVVYFAKQETVEINGQRFTERLLQCDDCGWSMDYCAYFPHKGAVIKEKPLTPKDIDGAMENATPMG
jgi:RNase P subunit RPR2